MTVKTAKANTSERFQPRKGVLLVDRLMNHFIKFGGIGVILAVFAIFFFILSQIIPLFQGAHVEHVKTIKLSEARSYTALGLDEWSERPLMFDDRGNMFFVDLAGDGSVTSAGPNFGAPFEISSFRYKQGSQSVVYGATDGRFVIADISYEPEFDGDVRLIKHEVNISVPMKCSEAASPLQMIDMGNAGAVTLVAFTQNLSGRLHLGACVTETKKTLFGSGKTTIRGIYNLTEHIAGRLQFLQVNAQADALAVANREGDVFYFYAAPDGITKRQTFRPFDDLSDPGIASMDFLQGGVSLVFTHASGENRIFSLYRQNNRDERIFGLTKTFKHLEGGAQTFAASLRNKAFLVAHDSQVSLRYATTENIRWEKKLSFNISQGILSGKYDHILLLDTEGFLHLYELEDPHPEAGWQAYFGKIWYEGASEPSYTWQSTGGTDEYEPKLSLVPLIYGSLKGTVYALIFALPIAILAAMYASQFAHPAFKKIVKPLMEVMASLPSVVLGFLGALWLAPLIEDRVPSLILVLLALPAMALLFGFLWQLVPKNYRLWFKTGYEFLLLIPILLVTTLIAWHLGPWLERLVFVVTDPETGLRVADFRQWWPVVTGTPYEQRNCLAVGFVMGFAVIPIIFTITEDALSNVAPPLRSASLALGASRWETTVRIILPVASAGILSAMMIGFGRAVGETMIVVMATGNTPIMDMNIFSGMRTLSANIAVELPEAPFQGTLYRTLFLGAMALFLMTFFVNTIAEVLREKLRRKYST